jgi:hypothetical protein
MNIKTITENMTAFLTGYGRGSPDRLQFIIQCTDWPFMANEAIRHRRAQFLESLDMETLEAIASQKLDLQQLAAKLLHTL